ncbi:hypothetical protein BN2497_6221 [Janthinobacterium sp. CG23_2]|nr:hypothetical protein BN2497_6221 [Janthinobacterium sp. CG23_2]CUU29508.1 hypothetical protein BN3177_6221 [Janthinobacterium sp. CG23_2]
MNAQAGNQVVVEDQVAADEIQELSLDEVCAIYGGHGRQA